VSRGEQPRAATRQLPQLGCAIPLQCILTDSDTRRDIPATKHYSSFLLPPCAPPLVTIKGREVYQLQGLDFR
jgi:hypothetical protein